MASTHPNNVDAQLNSDVSHQGQGSDGRLTVWPLDRDAIAIGTHEADGLHDQGTRSILQKTCRAGRNAHA